MSSLYTLHSKSTEAFNELQPAATEMNEFLCNSQGFTGRSDY